MKVILILLLAGLLCCSTAAFGATESSELLVLDDSTFVKIDRSDPENEIIQLFKVADRRIDLVDVIEIDTKQVNFKKLFEYRRLKIELKE